jgi:hypothetical protein
MARGGWNEGRVVMGGGDGGFRVPDVPAARIS